MKELLIVIMLSFCIAIEGSDDGMNEDCHVKDKFRRFIEKRTEIEWVAFLTKHTNLSMYVVYKGKSHVSFGEELRFNINEVYRIKKRVRKFLPKEEIRGNISLPLGWTNFFVEVENTFMNITVDSYQFNIDFEYPVHYLSIISDNLATCSKSIPTWKIIRNKTSTIPLDGLEIINFSLSCGKSFSPIIHIKEVIFNFQYHSGVKIGHENSPLPGGTYDFLMKKEIGKLILYSKEAEAGYVVIFEMALATDLMNMKLSSLDESFYIELNTKITIEDVITTKIPTTPENDGKFSSLQIFFALLAGILIGVITFIVIAFFVKKVEERKTRDKSCIEDGSKIDLISKEYEADTTFSQSVNQEWNDKTMKSKRTMKDSISGWKNCEDVKEYGVTIKQMKMTEDKENGQHNFQIWFYSEMIPKDNKNTKVVLLVGDPDVGNTTLINAMVNHIFGADMGFENNCRLRVDCDSNHIHKREELTAYCFPHQPSMIYESHFVLIKTHHFHNSPDNKHNEKIMQIKKFLDDNNGVNELHAICFVVKSDFEEVDILKNAYDSIFSLFGYDIKNNIFVLTTHDNLNDETPKVVEALNRIQKYYNTVFRFNLDKDFLTKERIREVTFQNMANLFKRIDKISPCSLKLTNVMITERTRLKESVDDLREKITKGVDKMSELQKKESEAPDPDEFKEINAELKYMEENVITKINEAKRANERLNELALPTVPHTINYFIDKLIVSERESQRENYDDRIRTLQKMKENNVYTKDILQDKALDGHTSIFQYFMDKPSYKKD